MIMCGDTCRLCLIDVGMRNLRVPDEKPVILRGNVNMCGDTLFWSVIYVT